MTRELTPDNTFTSEEILDACYVLGEFEEERAESYWRGDSQSKIVAVLKYVESNYGRGRYFWGDNLVEELID